MPATSPNAIRERGIPTALPPEKIPIRRFSYDIATIFSKDNGVDHWQLKSGNAKTGPLSVNIDLPALPNGYSPLKLEGGLSLGEGGAGDSGGSGGFSEGGVIAGETTDTEIQTNIVSVYRKLPGHRPRPSWTGRNRSVVVGTLAVKEKNDGEGFTLDVLERPHFGEHPLHRRVRDR